MPDVARTRGAGLVQPAAAGLIALLLRLPGLDSIPPDFDELYHLLAARSWLAEGTLRIADGSYERAAGYTVLVAQFLRVFGDSFAVARLPAALAGSIWVAAVFAWTRSYAGAAAAWIGALLLAFDPGSIHLSQWVRFYTLHALCVWIGLTTAYALVEHRHTSRRALALALTSAIAWVVALHLQVTTVVPLLAGLAWTLWRMFPRLPVAVRSRWRAGLLGGIVALLALATLGREQLTLLWEMYSRSPAWSYARADAPKFYVYLLGGRYVVLWSLFPVAALLALKRAPAVAGYSIVVFGLSFLVQSLGAAKSERYLVYALPFFFVIWALAVVEGAGGLQRAADLVLGRLPVLRQRPRARAAAAWLAVVAALLIAYRYNEAVSLTRRMLTERGNERPYSQPDWGAAAPALRELRASADVVVSSALLKALFYIGDAQVGLSRTELLDYQTETAQFARDPRTGRPMISRIDALERLVHCYRRGLLVVEKDHWRRSDVITGPVGDYIEARMEELPTDPEWRIKVFRWDQPRVAASDCPPWRNAP